MLHTEVPGLHNCCGCSVFRYWPMGTEKTKPVLRSCGCHKEMPQVRTVLSPTSGDSWQEQPRQWVCGAGGLIGDCPWPPGRAWWFLLRWGLLGLLEPHTAVLQAGTMLDKDLCHC